MQFEEIIRPKGGDTDNEEDDEDDLVRKNTRANALLPLLDSDAETGSEGGSDAESKTDTDASSVVDSDTNTDATSESDATFDDEPDELEDTPAMIAKKTATAASALANLESKKKTTKRVVKGKATLQDITTLQQSYDDLELNDGDGNGDSDGDGGDVNNDEDSDDGTNYLRKFDSEMRENYISTHHHELMQLSMAEVDALVRVVRNADGDIVDSMHKTMPFLTKYEKTRILGQRAKQLNQGAQPVIPVDKKIIDGYLIAQLELQQKALPFIVRRPLPGGKSEYWRLADLELI